MRPTGLKIRMEWRCWRYMPGERLFMRVLEWTAAAKLAMARRAMNGTIVGRSRYSSRLDEILGELTGHFSTSGISWDSRDTTVVPYPFVRFATNGAM